VLVAIGGRPDAVLDGLVDVVVVATANYHAPAPALLEIPFLLEALQVRERLDDGRKRFVVRALHVFVKVGSFTGMVVVAVHLLITTNIKIKATKRHDGRSNCVKHPPLPTVS